LTLYLTKHNTTNRGIAPHILNLGIR